MKHYFFFTAIIFLAVLGCIFAIEKTDLLNLRKIDITAEIHENGGSSVLVWERLPYPCYYRIDTYIKTTGTVTEESIYEHVKTEFTTTPSYAVSSAPIPFYYRITAYGMFGAVTTPSTPIATPYFMAKAPISISHYTEDHPASLMPFLVWHNLPNAVLYEVEILSAPPAQEGGTELSPTNHIMSTRSIFTNGWQADLRPYGAYEKLFWRVRGLDPQGNTVGTWSDIASFTVDTPTEKRIYAAALGDSITHGGGAISSSPAFLEYSYTTYLPFDCINLGRSGDTSHTTLERFDQDVLPLHPVNLLILTGSNSLRATGVTAQDIIDDLDELQKKCLSHNIRPIFLTLLPLNPDRISLAFHSETDLSWRWKMIVVNTWIRSQEFYVDI